MPSCSNVNLATNYTSSDDAGLSATVSAAPVIDTVDGSSVASDCNLAAIVKQDMDKFKEVNKKSRQTRVNTQKRYVVATHRQMLLFGELQRKFLSVLND